MTTSIPPGSVIVAADSSDDSLRAVRWAATQADLEGRPLAVVTTGGIDSSTAMGTWGLGAGFDFRPEEFLERAGEIAEAAAAEVRTSWPDVPVSVHPRIGDPRDVLVALSPGAHLIVLGSRGLGSFKSKVLGSVSAGVSRHAECPVVVCRPPEDGQERAGVLVGIDGTKEALPVAEFAFRQASVHGLPVTVLHSHYDTQAAMNGRSMVPLTDPDLEEQRLLMAQTVAGLSERYPDVHVERQLARGIAEEVLADDTGRWDLIVVGRHPVASLVRLLTASVATSVIERARTTVAVVPQDDPA